MKKIIIIAALVLGFSFLAAADNAHAQQTGSIRVCKIILDSQGNVVDGAAQAGDMFSVTLNGVGDAEFTAALNLNTDLLAGDGNDAECVTFSGLAITDHTYDAEIITGDTDAWATPLYNDQFTVDVVSLGDFFQYEFGGENLNADGHIVLTEERPNRTLVLLNQYQDHTCTGDDHVIIKIHNEAFVTNNLIVTTNTGDNTANGGDGGNGGSAGAGGDGGGRGGDGGSVRYGYYSTQTGGDGGDGGDSGDGGDGGDGGNGAAGGTITTGDAEAQGWLTNTVNSSDIDVNSCCGEQSSSEPAPCSSCGSELKLKVKNLVATVDNTAVVKANTGKNDADGGRGGNGGRGGRGGNDAGDGGNGGDTEGDQTDCGCECGGCQIPWNLLLDGDITQTGGNGGDGGDTGDGGNGGEGGEGAAGGTIDTGASTSYGDILNDVNSTIIRVRR